MLELMYITNNPQIAQVADKAGVDRIWIDLETKDKEKRQNGLDTVKSHHDISDISKIRPLLKHAQMQVRINHINVDSKAEIDAVLAAGVDYIMLPYYKTNEEVKTFIKYVNGRAITILLLETKEAVEILDETLLIEGVDEIHIGLNDLHLSLNQNFMFEPVADGMVENICRKIQLAGKPYGFGGIARLGEGMVSAEMVMAEHYRLRSTRVILSRSFCKPTPGQSLTEISRQFNQDLQALKRYEDTVTGKDMKFLDQEHLKFQQSVATVANMMRNKKQQKLLQKMKE
ncbi:MAG: HpcH/HpaI aldolase/citrate lyase family protein [Selenomonas sp.]|jgi:2-keto-3-deoxy-L-rhamnonate aldolase RhmA|nr:HpcH/HpaI aldolase/citrate lyase family protein [Selenomonas sp.]